MDFVLAMLFWDNGDPDRRRNAEIAWKQLQGFGDCCRLQALKVSCVFYDFSEQPLFPDATVHIAYPAGQFRKTEKINRLLQHAAASSPRFIGVFDADIVIREQDYDFLIRWMRQFRESHYYVCEVDDLLDNSALDYDRGSIDYALLNYRPRSKGLIGDLGGLYFLPLCKALALKPFDERFTEWGGEDNAASLVLQAGGLEPLNLFIRPLHLFHQSLENSAVRSKQYSAQVTLLAELQRQQKTDGFLFVLAPDQLRKVLSREVQESGRDAFVKINQDCSFQGLEPAQRKSILEFVYDSLLPDRQLVKAAKQQDDLSVPLFLRLLNLSGLLRGVSRALTQELSPGQEFDGQLVARIFMSRYGGKPEAGQQAYVFLYWLQALGILQRTSARSHHFRWLRKLAIPESQSVLLLRSIFRFEGHPPGMPLAYLINAPAWKFLDMEQAVEGIKKSGSEDITLVNRNGVQYIEINSAGRPGCRDE